MHLKSLNIVGFKTFADETEIVFDPGFTAVVGPNGCGKSNIVDSVKWVFGEKSAKGLRGEKMDDVIFHGSEARKSAGFAEVSILFDNSDHFFHVDYPHFKIARRLYPDGENEYYINDVRSARKDVEKTLLDTGIGKSSYSIMEQGKVDQLLNSKPEERRAIFEEAAGISRFKLERKEALKKLDDTDKNLQRISDILHSMQKEMETKERQSEKAEIYFKLKNDMNEADKNIRYMKIRDFKIRLHKYESELAEIKEKNQLLLSQISEETGRIEALEQDKSNVEKEIVEIDKKLMDHLSRTQVQKEKIAKNKEIILDYDNRILEMNDSIRKENEALVRLQSERESILTQIQNLRETCEALREELSLVSTLKNDLQAEVEAELEAIKKREIRLSDNETTNTKLREETRDVILELVLLLESRKKDAQGKEEERLVLKEELLNTLENYTSQFLDVKNQIVQGNSNNVVSLIEQIDLSGFKLNLQNYMDLDDHFRSMFLEKDGILSKKEDLDRRMEDLILDNENLTRANRISQERMDTLRSDIEIKSHEIVTLEKKILENTARESNLQENQEGLVLREKELSERIQGIAESLVHLQERKFEFEEEVRKLEKEIEDSYNEFLSMSKALESQKESLKAILGSIHELKSNIAKNQEVFQGLFPILTEKEKNCSALRVQIESVSEELYNDYSMTELELENERSQLELKKTDEEARLRNAKFEIQQLGSINPLAIEEYRNTKEIYEHHRKQKEDIESSKRDIETVLDAINKESEVLFRETFERIRENFQETFSTLFRGGRASLELTEKEDSLNSGIEILAEPPGKHVQNLRLLSGGEKSLTAIALMFAIYMVKPSPFCFLDEIDAALDEANKLRFCAILDKFKDKTQFIVISHAQSTISRANAIFGVTNEEAGISKLVSLKLEQARTFAEHLPRASVG
ncbi:chromosome segregation SMC family protein [Leptospira sp. GIMC2001]|uniref:chromosome segregation SMC family protein n=1 Tax=Leptospira sp. GIMC2001 TaxID=1513297 RepID=UPI0004A5C5AC|nr:AAA family ATPase [Leptospira sp. GIMC2001]AID56279.1 chromosome partition protein smc [Leptospira sp. GIMC2001]WCL48375.1 AAA family ATPase [Leptospira sp. GIMC2001]